MKGNLGVLKRGFMKKAESGYTMLEMIAALAIMGLLSIVAVLGIRIAVNKAKANDIVHDSRVVMVESLSRQGDVVLNQWEEYKEQTESGLPFYMMRDIRNKDYVKVSNVLKEVCAQMLNLQKEGELVFLLEQEGESTVLSTFSAFVECQEENVIVMAFDGLGEPKMCERRRDCGDNFQGKCDADGRCKECDASLEAWDDAMGLCVCDDDKAITCTDEENNKWCCPNRKYLCGVETGTCVDDPHQCNDVADCEDRGLNNHYCDEEHQCVKCPALATVDAENNECVCDSNVAITCKVEVENESAATTEEEATEENPDAAAQSNTKLVKWCCGDGTVCDVENRGCKPKTDDWCEYTLDVSNFEIKRATDCAYRLDTSGFSINRATNCAYRLDTSGFSINRATNCAYQITTTNLADGTTRLDMAPYNGLACSGNTYCAMTYADAGCNNYAGAGASIIYGTCLPTNNFTPTCTTEPQGSISFTPVEGKSCSGDTYCAMTYADEGCNSYAGAGATIIYGTCLPTNNFTPTCTTEPQGSISFTPVEGKSCSGDTYCAMTYADAGCNSYAGAGATVIYGTCLPTNNFTPTCTTEPQGEIKFEPVPGKECPAQTFCAMAWRNNTCQNAGAGETHLYGQCQSLNNQTPKCP